MKLGSTLQRAAPTDKCTPSRNVSSIDQWRPLFERSALGVAMMNSGFRFPYSKSGISDDVRLLERGAAKQLSFLDICVDEAGDECRIQLREVREGVRLQYEIETAYRREDGTSLPVNTYFFSR